MKIVRSNLSILLAERQRRTGKRLSSRAIARETGLNEYTVRGFVNDTLSEFPRRAITELCRFLNCTPGELLVLEDDPNSH